MAVLERIVKDSALPAGTTGSPVAGFTAEDVETATVETANPSPKPLPWMRRRTAALENTRFVSPELSATTDVITGGKKRIGWENTI